MDCCKPFPYGPFLTSFSYGQVWCFLMDRCSSFPYGLYVVSVCTFFLTSFPYGLLYIAFLWTVANRLCRFLIGCCTSLFYGLLQVVFLMD